MVNGKQRAQSKQKPKKKKKKWRILKGFEFEPFESPLLCTAESNVEP